MRRDEVSEDNGRHDLRIGELSAATGVSVRAIRYYESVGLVGARRSQGGWRAFDPSAVDRVILIQHLLAAGLKTDTIAELLPCLEAPLHQRTGHLASLLSDEVQRLERRRRELDRELDTLRALQADEVPVEATPPG